VANDLPARSTLKRVGRTARTLLLLVLLGLAVHLLLPQIATLEHSVQVLRGMKWWAVALAAGMQVGSYLGSGYLLRAIVATVGQGLSVIRGTLVTTAAYSIGLVAGGSVGIGAATYRWVRGSGVSTEGALLAGWLPNLFNTGILVLASFAGMIYLLIVHHLTTLQIISFGLIVLVLGSLGGMVVWGVHRRPQLTRAVQGLAARWARLRRQRYNPVATEEAVGRLFSAWDMLRAGGWRGPALGAALNVILDMLTLYAIFVAAGHPVSVGVLLAGYGLPLLLAKMTILPGGVGLVEGSMAALYTSLGVPDAVTVVAILSYRFLSFWLPSLLGFPLILYLQHTASSFEDEPAPEGDPL